MKTQAGTPMFFRVSRGKLESQAMSSCDTPKPSRIRHDAPTAESQPIAEPTTGSAAGISHQLVIELSTNQFVLYSNIVTGHPFKTKLETNQARRHESAQRT